MILYADSNSGRALYPEVANKIKEMSDLHLANPSQILSPLGRKAREIIEVARHQIADLLGAESSEVVFTSGATESCFQAIFGASLAKVNGDKILISNQEHPAVSEACVCLNRLSGVVLEQSQSLKNAEIDTESFLEKIDKKTFLVSLMAANNETGVCFNWQRVAKFCEEKNITYHSDITQLVGKSNFNFKSSGIKLASLSSHKIGGPQGVGALLVSKDAKWEAPIKAGGQEQGRRGGTEAVLAIAAFGLAAELAKSPHSSAVRDCFEERLNSPDLEIIARYSNRLPNTSMLILNGVAGNDLVEALSSKGIFISSGSACSQGSGSKVLRAIGYSEREARSAVRVSFMKEATLDDAKLLSSEVLKQLSIIKSANIRELKNIYER